MILPVRLLREALIGRRLERLLERDFDLRAIFPFYL